VADDATTMNMRNMASGVRAIVGDGSDHTGYTPHVGPAALGTKPGSPTAFSLQGSGSGSPTARGSSGGDVKNPPTKVSRATQLRAMVFATLNVSIAATGTGFLSFPFAFQQAGYLGGLALCVGTSLLCAYSLTVIALCARDHNARSYQELVLVMFGERWRQIVQWLVIIFNFTGNIVSLQVISSEFSALLEQAAPHSRMLGGCSDSNACKSATIAVVTVVILPLCLLRNMESLGPTSSIGACCVLFTSVVVSVHGISSPEQTPGHEYKAEQLHLTAFQAISIVCFATMCHFTVVPATATLHPYFPPTTPRSSSVQAPGPGAGTQTPNTVSEMVGPLHSQTRSAPLTGRPALACLDRCQPRSWCCCAAA
jgi:hypothetical protein